MDEVTPTEEMPPEIMTKHIQARHLNPFLEVGLWDPVVNARDRRVWEAYHKREHLVYDDHDHYHRGDYDGSGERHSSDGDG